MPKKPHKDRYLEKHQRNICLSCIHWVPWYQDKKGKQVFGCELGLIPFRDECAQLLRVKGAGKATVI